LPYAEGVTFASMCFSSSSTSGGEFSVRSRSAGDEDPSATI
jgi:hypothetical protein